MNITKRISLLMPTVQYGNATVDVTVEVNTDNKGDLSMLNLEGQPEQELLQQRLNQFLESEVFSTKAMLEEHSMSDFKLAV